MLFNNMIKNITNLFSKSILLYKVSRLDISESGIDDEGDPYVKLKDGTIFYGSKLPFPRPRFVQLYPLLPKKIKQCLRVECLQVAMDIVVRYVEQGLMYGGPRKQSHYKVKLNDRVSEMGAFQGFFSLRLAQLIGPSGSVVAIEPVSENFRVLEKNIAANNFQNIKAVHVGVWHERDTLEFSKRPGDGQSSSIDIHYDSAETFSMEVDSLDNIYSSCECFPDDFMVIQLNGAEINALRGLTLCKPKHMSIAARYDIHDENSALVIESELINRGYDVKVVKDDFVFASLL